MKARDLISKLEENPDATVYYHNKRTFLANEEVEEVVKFYEDDGKIEKVALF